MNCNKIHKSPDDRIETVASKIRLETYGDASRSLDFSSSRGVFTKQQRYCYYYLLGFRPRTRKAFPRTNGPFGKSAAGKRCKYWEYQIPIYRPIRFDGRRDRPAAVIACAPNWVIFFFFSYPLAEYPTSTHRSSGRIPTR